MVLVPIDPSVVGEAIELAKAVRCAIWVGSDGVTAEDFSGLARSGLSVTRFAYPFSDISAEEVDRVLETIALHHPGEAIWVQHRPRPLE